MRKSLLAVFVCVVVLLVGCTETEHEVIVTGNSTMLDEECEESESYKALHNVTVSKYTATLKQQELQVIDYWQDYSSALGKSMRSSSNFVTVFTYVSGDVIEKLKVDYALTDIDMRVSDRDYTYITYKLVEEVVEFEGIWVGKGVYDLVLYVKLP